MLQHKLDQSVTQIYHPIAQAPNYSDQRLLNKVLQRLMTKPAIVELLEIQALNKLLNELYEERGIILQAGECAETFELMQPETITRQAKLIVSLGKRLQSNLNKPVLVNSRLGGQFAKPRTYGFSQLNRQLLPTYYGDLINGQELNQRQPNPMRMLLGYQVMKRAMQQLMDINIGVGSKFFTMHEAYHLPFEQALLRSQQQQHWASTGHIVWVGARTNHPKYAHVQFVKNIQNPIGIKISSALRPSQLQEILTELSPRPAPIMLILRLGCKNTKTMLPSLVRAANSQRVFWILDPMHGNTHRLKNGVKTRVIPEMQQEIYDTAQILTRHGTYLAGIHLELTATKVRECVDDLANVSCSTHFDAGSMICDPRLNSLQAERLVDTYAQVIT